MIQSLSQFYKVIILMILSIFIFLGFKEALPNRLFSEPTSTHSANVLVDSTLLAAINEDQIIKGDSLLVEPPEVTSANLAKEEKKAPLLIEPFTKSNFLRKLENRKPILYFPDETTNIVRQKPIIDTLLDPTLGIHGYGYLQRFYSKLANLKKNPNNKVRVAYFGDSMNDGDLIVQDFRRLLQEEFGGKGVGFVPITSLSSASRASVVHKHSTNWYVQSFVSVRRPSVPFGVDGQIFLALDKSAHWVSYTAGAAKNAPMLYNPTLFYGGSANREGYVTFKTDNNQEERYRLFPSFLLNTKAVGINRTKYLSLSFTNIPNIPIYGMDFSSNEGVYVDNFSLRGNSGLTLANFNTDLMNAFDKVLHYDLIVLQYGANVLNHGSLDYKFYEKNMKVVVEKLRQCFPNADILVISTADKSSKVEGKMETDAAVYPLFRAQKQFSRDTGTGFIDLFNLMGGTGSMVEWVNNNLANKDYTHFNVKGSKEIGELLYKELEKGYEKYNIQLDKERIREQKVNNSH